MKPDDQMIDFSDPDQVRAWLSERRGRKAALARLCDVHKTSVEGWWYRGRIPDKHLETIAKNRGKL